MASNERIRKYLDAASVLGQVTRGRAEEIVRELVNAGDIPRGQAQEWVDTMVEQARRRVRACSRRCAERCRPSWPRSTQGDRGDRQPGGRRAEEVGRGRAQRHRRGHAGDQAARPRPRRPRTPPRAPGRTATWHQGGQRGQGAGREDGRRGPATPPRRPCPSGKAKKSKTGKGKKDKQKKRQGRKVKKSPGRGQRRSSRHGRGGDTECEAGGRAEEGQLSPSPRRRLDNELVRRGLVRTRQEAQAAIAAGSVLVAGAPAAESRPAWSARTSRCRCWAHRRPS